PSTPSFPSHPSSPSTPSRPSSPSWPSTPSSPSYPGDDLPPSEHHSLAGAATSSPLGLVIFVFCASVLVGLVLFKRWDEGRHAEWESSVDEEPSPPPPKRSARKRLQKLRTYDDNFSLVLFEDFLYALYAAAHEARGRGTLDRLAGYLSETARAGLVP